MVEHGKHQDANDWVTCLCGKVFGDSPKTSKWEKLVEHLKVMRVKT